ncbi:hypothetical protein ACOSP6_14975 [Tenacibaculum sp. MEBiC06402]|uniref:hypothetical protein n=1 Tax=unclassified Tenacibaculum TaxID=2635139 RepID=UPI003B9D30EB
MRHLLILTVLNIFFTNSVIAQDNNSDNVQDFSVSISRAKNQTPISLKEWFEYIEMDASVNFKMKASNTLSKNSTDNSLIFLNYKDEKKVQLKFSNGVISVKKPSKDILFKMFLISKRLNADIKDSNGKIYTNDDFYKN